jgi:4-amino-4-deoxy-L-arabinose transferase-like glycosyltransferase
LSKIFNRIRFWINAHPNLTLAFVTLAALVPFLPKPFNLDEPLFIWTAKQIQSHPLNPYGFEVNWYGTVMPMWQVTQNPPLASYYLALAAKLFGWSEVGLHLAFMFPAVAVILGTYRLAGHFCQRPLLAAGLTLCTPVFLVSSTTVMCDVLMLAFWVWAVVLWMEGVERDSFLWLAGSGCLVALAVLTKYFGACLIPLLALYSIMGKRRSGRWALCLLIPLAAILIYEWLTFALYGQGLFFTAVNHAVAFKENYGYSVFTTCLITLTFSGGCLAVVVFFAPLLWRPRALATIAAATLLIVPPIFFGKTFFEKYDSIPSAARMSVEIQFTFWAIGGICALMLAIENLLKQRDPRSWLLAFWMVGTFLFAAFFNWTINGRTILPMAPAVGILLVRHLEQIEFVGIKTRPRFIFICTMISAIFSLMIAHADFLYAKSVRASVEKTIARYGQAQTLWFEGHWGFQFYMEKFGAKALDLANSSLKSGDNLAVPLNNSNLYSPKPEMAMRREILTDSQNNFIATMNKTSGAGFYGSLFGPLPFAFGPVGSERVAVLTFTKEIQTMRVK